MLGMLFEMLLFLLTVVVGVVVFIRARDASEHARRNESYIANLQTELRATRSAFLGRIEDLQGQITALQEKGSAGSDADKQQAATQQTAMQQAEARQEGVPTAPPPKTEPASVSPPSDEPPGDAPREDERPAPPPQAPPPTEPLSALAPAQPIIDWEQWIGVRGAAVLGGIVLALAAVMFLRYAVEHQLIPPVVRVTAGFFTGLAAIAFSEKLRSRKYTHTANPLAGAGVVVLYVSVWAAHALYELIGAGFGFFLMILITTACGALSWRYQAKEVAVLGLIGGFATPILLSTGSDNPIGLFGYVLLLDVGLLWLARERRWPWLTAMALAGTFFYQAVWILVQMGPDRQLLGLVILGFFALFFAASSRLRTFEEDDEESELIAKLAPALGIAAPFLLALHFAGNADLGEHLYPVAALLTILSIAANWLARNNQIPQLAGGAAAATAAIVFTWFARTSFTTSLTWEAVGVCAVLALAYHGFLEFDLRRGIQTSVTLRSAAAIVSLGFFASLVGFSLASPHSVPWPWLAGWIAMAALLVRQSFAPDFAWSATVAAVGLGLAFPLYYRTHLYDDLSISHGFFFALTLLVTAAFQVLAMASFRRPVRQAMETAAAAMPATILVLFLAESADSTLAPRLYLATTIVLACFAVLSATRMRSGPLYFCTVALLALNHISWTNSASWLHDEPGTTSLALFLQFFTTAALSLWPFAVGKTLTGERWALYGAALAAPFWFLPLRQLYEARLGDSAIGLLPIALGSLSLAAVALARRLGPAESPAQFRAMVWFSTVALGFVSLAIPLQLDKEWITLAWAIQGFAITELWKRLDHPGLKYFALALLLTVTVRLVFNPEILSYHPRSGWPIVNWLAYTYLIPAAALLAAARNLHSLEVERVADWEKRLYRAGRPDGAIACALGAITVVFAWINLTIFDFFSTGRELTFTFERAAARDLTLSLGWALYALLLLGIGFRRDSEALRWVSLAFLVLTIGKVFLYDLGELEDLYRVASLVGLALSLMLVSLAYQRFVFRKNTSKEEIE